MMRSLTARFARQLFAHSKKPSRTPTFQPQIESLERREVLSVSSPLPHADSAIAWDPARERIFYINRSDHALYVATADTKGYLTPWVLSGWSHAPASVQTLSAGHGGSNGNDDVVVEAGDGSLWEDTFLLRGTTISQMLNWKELLGPGQVQSFAAVDGGRVFAIFSDGTLHRFDGVSWSVVPTRGTVKALDAVTDKFGHDTVYVLNSDNTFGEVTYLPAVFLTGPTSMAVARTTSLIPGPGSGIRVSLSQPHYTQLAPAHFIAFGRWISTFPEVINFSAGTDANGYADVFATWWTGDLFKNVGNTANGWSLFAVARTFQEYSAIDRGHVWITSGTGVLTLYTAPGKTAIDPLFGPVTLHGPLSSISGVGAGGNYAWGVFYVDPSDGELLYTVYEPSYGSFNNGGASSHVYPYLG
jgi:hypothetical protein